VVTEMVEEALNGIPIGDWGRGKVTAGVGRNLVDTGFPRARSATSCAMTSAQDLDGRLGEPRHGHQATSIQISALFTPTLVKGVPVAGSVPRMLVLQM
jgi:hypothetical protein